MGSIETIRLSLPEAYAEVVLQAADAEKRMGMFGEPGPSPEEFAAKLDKAREAAGIPEAYARTPS